MRKYVTLAVNFIQFCSQRNIEKCSKLFETFTFKKAQLKKSLQIWDNMCK